MYKVSFGTAQQVLFGVERFFSGICIHILCFQIFVRKVIEIKPTKYVIGADYIKGFNS